MASLDKIKLTLNPSSDNYQYIITMIDEVRDNLEQSATTFTIPGETYRNNALLGVNGQESIIEVFWRLHNDGETDYANSENSGYGSPVNTIREQILYLKDTIHDPSFSSKWTIVDSAGIYGDYSDPATGLEVYLESVNIPTFQRNSPKWRECSMTLVVGDLVF